MVGDGGNVSFDLSILFALNIVSLFVETKTNCNWFSSMTESELGAFEMRPCKIVSVLKTHSLFLINVAI